MRLLASLIALALLGTGAPVALAQDAEAPAAEGDAPPLEERTITVAVSGDLLVHTAVWRQAEAHAGGAGYDFRPMFRRIRPLIAGADLAVCHLETPLTSSAPASYPIFSTPLALAPAIRRAGWDACTTASNHSLDRGPDGIAQTLRALDRQRIRHVGTARSEPEFRRPVILETRSGVRVAILSWTQVTNGQVPDPAWRVNQIGTDPGPILVQARRAWDRGADAVIVNLHGGDEYRHVPSADQVELARALGRSGLVTAIVGQHAHVVQPIRWAGGVLALYGEGNLLSAQGLSPAGGMPAATQDGLIGLLRIRVPVEGRAVLARIDYMPTFVDHVDYTVVPVGVDRSKPEYAASWRRTVGTMGKGARFGPWRRLAP